MADTSIDKRTPTIPEDLSPFATLLLADVVTEGYRKEIPPSLWAEAEEIVDRLGGTLSEPTGPEGDRIRVLTLRMYEDDTGAQN